MEADPSSILLADYLEKSPPLNKATSALKGFKRRWFVLRRDTTLLSYYTSNNTKQEPKGTIDMAEALSVEAHQRWPGPQSDKHPFVFTIETKSGRIYYLSAASRESMAEWVGKLTATFKFYLEQNRPEDSAAEGSYSSGVIPVHVSLISCGRSTVMVQATETTPARDVLLQALRAADKSPDSIGLYTLVAVDKELGTSSTVGPEELPLVALRGCRRLRLHVVHADEAHYATKLVKLEDQKAMLEEGRFESSYTVRYLGSVILPLPADSRQPPTRPQVTAALEQLRKRPRAEENELQLLVSTEGIKVLTPTGNPRRPYAIVLQQSLHGVANCLDIDKVFVYVSAPTPTQARTLMKEFKCFAFKCNDKKTSTDIREVVTLNCNKLFVQLHDTAKRKGVPLTTLVRDPSAKPDSAAKQEAEGFQSLPEEDLHALLRAAELPLGVASLADIERYLDAEEEDDD